MAGEAENEREQENAELRRRLDEEVGRLNRLVEITGLLNSTLKLEDLLGLIMSSATELLDAETSSLFLLDETSGELTAEIATGEPGQAVAKQRVPAGSGMAGWVVANDEPAVVDEPKNDPRFYSDIDESTGFETRNMLAVPMRTKERVIGAIEVINRRSGSFAERDLQMASALADQAAIAIDNARLYARLADAVVTSRHVLPSLARRSPGMAARRTIVDIWQTAGADEDADGVPRQGGGRVARGQLALGARASGRARRRLPRARARARRQGGAREPYAARVDALRLRPRLDGRDRRADLPDELARGVRVHRRRLGRACSRLRRRQAAGGHPRLRDGHARARARDRHRRDARGRDTARRDRRQGTQAARRASRRGRGGPERGIRVGRPHVHLHLGDDRPSQGLRADARELVRHGRLGPAGRRLSHAGRCGPPVPPPGAQLRPARPVCRGGDRVPHRLLSRHRPGDPRPDGGSPDRPAERPQALRDDLRERALEARRGNGAHGGGSSTGRSTLGRERPPSDSRAPASRRCSRLQLGIAHRLVFSKVTERLGGQVRLAISGGAPLSKEIIEFFAGLGLLILEGYGLTETTSGCTLNTPTRYRFGTRRPCPARHRRLDRGRRGDPRARPDHLPGLPREGRGDPGGARRGRLAPNRRHRQHRRRRLRHHHRPEEGPDHHVRRQERVPAEPRERAQGLGARLAGSGRR